jgi:hypothetical protein
VGSGPHGQQTARVLAAFEAHLTSHRPAPGVWSWLDVNSTMACPRRRQAPDSGRPREARSALLRPHDAGRGQSSGDGCRCRPPPGQRAGRGSTSGARCSRRARALRRQRDDRLAGFRLRGSRPEPAPDLGCAMAGTPTSRFTGRRTSTDGDSGSSSARYRYIRKVQVVLHCTPAPRLRPRRRTADRRGGLPRLDAPQAAGYRENSLCSPPSLRPYRLGRRAGEIVVLRIPCSPYDPTPNARHRQSRHERGHCGDLALDPGRPRAERRPSAWQRDPRMGWTPPPSGWWMPGGRYGLARRPE